MASVLNVSDTTVAFDNTRSVRYISLPAPPDMVLEDDTTVAFNNTSSVRYISLPAPSDTVLEDDVPLVLSIEGPLPYSVANRITYAFSEQFEYHST